MEKEIEKPWAIYGWYPSSMYIGKIIKELSGSVWIEYSEGQEFIPQCWDSKKIIRFDKSFKSVAYFLAHQTKNCEERYNKKSAIKLFLRNFPSEKRNIERAVHLN